MTVALGSGQADDPEGVSDPGAPIKSEAVLTLVMTRAHVVAVMRDPRLSVHAKMVGCLLWSTTETWQRGESKTVSFKEIGAQIVLERRGRTGPLSEASVRRALNELENAGYVRVDKSGCVGRGKPSTVTMVRRRLADPLTQDASGPWRVWTKRQMDDVAAREEMANEPEAAPAATAEGFPVRHPSAGKGAQPGTHSVQRVPSQAPSKGDLFRRGPGGSRPRQADAPSSRGTLRVRTGPGPAAGSCHRRHGGTVGTTCGALTRSSTSSARR